MNGLQAQLEQSRLQEAELLGALKEMQDKVLDLEKVRTSVVLYHPIGLFVCVLICFVCVCACRGAAPCLTK